MASNQKKKANKNQLVEANFSSEKILVRTLCNL